MCPKTCQFLQFWRTLEIWKKLPYMQKNMEYGHFLQKHHSLYEICNITYSIISFYPVEIVNFVQKDLNPTPHIDFKFASGRIEAIWDWMQYSSYKSQLSSFEMQWKPLGSDCWYSGNIYDLGRRNGTFDFSKDATNIFQISKVLLFQCRCLVLPTKVHTVHLVKRKLGVCSEAMFGNDGKLLCLSK